MCHRESPFALLFHLHPLPLLVLSSTFPYLKSKELRSPVTTFLELFAQGSVPIPTSTYFIQ